MAQETRIAPLTLNDDAAKIWMDLGDSVQKQRQQQAQLNYENNKLLSERQREQQRRLDESNKETNHSLSTLEVSPEEMNNALAAVAKTVAKARLGGMSVDDAMAFNQQTLNQITYAANTRKAINAQAEAALKDNPSLDKGALLNTLTSQFLTQHPRNLDVNNNDYAQQVLGAPDSYRLFNKDKATTAYTGFIAKPSGPIAEESEKTVDQNGAWRTNESVRWKFDPRWYKQDGKGNVVLKSDADGLLDPQAYNDIISNKSNDAALTYKAQQFIEHYNAARPSDKERWMKENGINLNEISKGTFAPPTIDQNSGVVDNLKRAFATHDVLANSPVSKNGVTSSITTKNYLTLGGQTGGEYKDVIPDVDNTIKTWVVRTKDSKGNVTGEAGAPLNKIKSAFAQAAILKLSNNVYDTGEQGSKLTAKNITIQKNSDGNYDVYKYENNKRGELVTTLSPTDINEQANADLGTKAKKAAVAGTPKPKDKGLTGASGL
jgi:hypothetical protein